ncbi:hypothetical protein ACFQFC_13130 [Amorphoplanes digitatis]|uniref:Cell division protein FtsB n=1 Tax=Actinoplanes digitatis TaxID=1868 RepID=A0A7W7I2D0_9ACTN|nr:hypothetical protein [Actinoplanes digitatis]MBB4765145.1 cell division protein FtsB [Actinoplanes digitatis]BFE74882.1 hypothetical protein GCM10020092_081830 [Actinoplanes digitatis]GID98080.1 hypothetical protein Adi01nite_74920 [Actinoplanes digitatis]
MGAEPDQLELDQKIADLEAQVQGLRSRIGERADGPTDAAEASLLLTEIAEQEAILAALTARRDEIKERPVR